MKTSYQQEIKHKFVEFIPPTLEQGVLYISIVYRTAQHLCICGCGERVVTPFTPSDWSITFNGATVTLNPSIGNWNFKCKTHYWITNNKIIIARRWSDYEIQKGRAKDGRKNMRERD
jgi:hypothetical protein